MSFNRPRPGDTEEDILEIQRQFLERKLKPSMQVIKRKSVPTAEISESRNLQSAEDIGMEVDPPKKALLAGSIESHTRETIQMNKIEAEMDAKDNHITAILTKITERDTMQMPIYFPSPRTTSFPLVHHRLGEKENPQPKKKSKKSIFAQQFKKQSEEQSHATSPHHTEKDPVKPCLPPIPQTIPVDQLQKLYPRSTIISGSGLSSNKEFDEGRKIHEENIDRLSGMSEQEAINERNALLQEMNPQTIAFLQRRTKPSKSEYTEAKQSVAVNHEYYERRTSETSMDHASSTKNGKSFGIFKLKQRNVIILFIFREI